jgi:hypothetical protein
MALGWMGALKLVPWNDVLEAAPTLVQTARRVLGASKAQAEAHASLAQQVVALEKQCNDLAQLSGQLAQHNLQLVAALDALQRKLRWLIAGCAATGAVALAGLVAALR